MDFDTKKDTNGILHFLALYTWDILTEQFTILEPQNLVIKTFYDVRKILRLY